MSVFKIFIVYVGPRSASSGSLMGLRTFTNINGNINVNSNNVSCIGI